MTRRLPILVLLVCGGAFAFGLFQLFKLRFAAGDVYPEYSSLRSDPLGTMIFYESLERIPRLSVQRDFNAQNRLPDGKAATYLHLAASRFDWRSLPDDVAEELERFLTRGGRFVIALSPETTGSAPFVARPGPPAKRTAKKIQAHQPPARRRSSLQEHWGVDFGFVALERGSGESFLPARVVNRTELPLPKRLDWHSGTVLTNLDSSWRTIYARGANAVVAERRFGPGSVVLATDSYYLSNQALTQNPRSALLAWVAGPGERIFFDEAHFGIMEQAGVATLMRQYRLHGLAVALLLLAALFIWKNSMSFVPPNPGPQGPGPLAGKDAAAGFVNLLRRNIAPRDLLRLCFDEWTKSLVQGGSYPISRVDQAQAVLEAEYARAQTERDPVRAYRQICRVLRRHHSNQPPKNTDEH